MAARYFLLVVVPALAILLVLRLGSTGALLVPAAIAADGSAAAASGTETRVGLVLAQLLMVLGVPGRAAAASGPAGAA
jgi:hypothetical protein